MIELLDKADKYAAGKINEAIDKVIAQAYADGYRDGYKDREEEIPVDFRDNQTEYVDLGLPSGTLWAKDYERKNGEVIFLPYCQTIELSLPTKERWNELFSLCHWEYTYLSNSSSKYDCIGPNGNFIAFYSHGYSLIGSRIEYQNRNYFWLNDQCENPEKKSHMYVL